MPPPPPSIIQKNKHIKKETTPWVLSISHRKWENKKLMTTICSKRAFMWQELNSDFSSHGTQEKKKHD